MNPVHHSIARTGVLAAMAVALAFAVGARPAAAAEYGTIKGRLVLGGTDVAKSKVDVKKGDANKKDNAVCAAQGDLLSDELVVDAKTRGVESGIAYLVKPKGDNPEARKAITAKTPKVDIDQKHCKFVPHVTTLIKDQSVVFKSSDPVAHNVRISGFNNASNVSIPPNGQLPAKLVPEPRPINLNCDIHPWMSGKIMVFDHPFFAVTKADGTFEIRGVPAGTQSLVLSHEKVGYVTPNKAKGQEVKVTAGETTDIGDVTLDPKNFK